MQRSLSQGSVTLDAIATYPGNWMCAAKIERNAVKVFEVRTGSLKRAIGCSSCKSVVAANVTGEQVAATCSDGLVRVCAIRTGCLKSTL